MNTLHDHFENTRNLTSLTGNSVYTAGIRIDNIRKTTLAKVKVFTNEQQHLKETEEIVDKWLEYNEKHNFIDE